MTLQHPIAAACRRPRIALGLTAALACFALALLPGSAAADGLQLSVVPQQAVVGKETCFTFTANQDGEPVSGAAVEFESGDSETTGADGDARLCVTLDYPGEHGAVVEVGEQRAGTRVSATVPPGAAAPTEEWHHIHPFVQGTECTGAFGSSQVGGSCRSVFLKNPCCDFAPLPDGRFYFRWEPECNGCSSVRIILRLSSGELLGSIPDRGSDRLTISRGFVSSVGPIVSGSDPTKRAGEKGGPLGINVVNRSRFPLEYDFDIQGWLYY